MVFDFEVPEFLVDFKVLDAGFDLLLDLAIDFGLETRVLVFATLEVNGTLLDGKSIWTE